ncbi:MAG: hypothetical protein LBT92_02720 [Rickettsiales bacterium]|jgi:hypothetical protein|nr:hypothetical protein [Rickettsiales bacterium]
MKKSTKLFAATCAAALALTSGAKAEDREIMYGILAEKDAVPLSKMACNNATFGDPAGKTRKQCFDAVGITIAKEGDEFTVPGGSAKIRYGAIVRKTVPSGSPCGDETFGDPAKGVKKYCYIHGFKIAEQGGTISY